MHADSRRNAGIDRLRGVAILLVVLHHTGLRLPLGRGVLGDYLPHWLLAALNYNGYEAVFVFFVISGFLIAGHALQRWGSLARIDLPVFYRQRAARILPCLFLLLAVLALLHGLGVADYVIHRPGQSLHAAVLSALGLYLNWYEGHYGYLPGNWDVLWSLSIEEVFYLGFPLLCWVLRWRWLLSVALSVLALSLPWTHAALAANEIWQEKAYLPGMAAIALGVLGALLAQMTPPRVLFQRLALYAGWCGLAAIVLIESTLWPVLRDGCLLLLTVSVLCLLLGLHWHAQADRQVQRDGWLQAWGRMSYEIYLSHMFVVFGLLRLFHALGGGLRWGVLAYVPILLLSAALGWLLRRLWSQPLERWLRRGRATPVMADVAA